MKKIFIIILTILAIPTLSHAYNWANHSEKKPMMAMEQKIKNNSNENMNHNRMKMMNHVNLLNSKNMADSTKEYVQINHKMHMGMDIEFTGDADIDFLAGMIPHHQGAIDMAKTQLKHGHDGILKSFTKKVIRDQEREIFFMQGLLDSLKENKSKNGSTIAFKRANRKMHKDMSIEFTDNADIDFVKGMIPHHKGAVDMAKVVLKYGKNTNAKKIAYEIINAQELEISWLKRWLHRVNLIKNMR